jgi:rhodanese-related sulfurtransferase
MERDGLSSPASPGPQSAAAVPDISPARAWALLTENPGAALIDVRSRPEWNFVGLCDLSSLGRKPACIAWQHWTERGMARNESFAREFAALGIDRDAPVMFICRSGARSRAAAEAMAALGWRRCYNVAGGFEGDRDAARHRGVLGGWKAANLPWVQE